MAFPTELNENEEVSIAPALVILFSIALVVVSVAGTFLGYSYWVTVGFFYAAALTGGALFTAGFGVSAFAAMRSKATGYSSKVYENDVLIFSLCPAFERSELRSLEVRRKWSHVIESRRYVDLQRCLMKYNAGKRIVVIDDEGFDLYDLIEKLLSLRTNFPDVRVILLSDDVAGDDFSATRAPICDVTLKKPISPKRLALAFEGAGV